MVIIVNLLIIAACYAMSRWLLKHQQDVAQRIQRLNAEYGVSQKDEN